MTTNPLAFHTLPRTRAPGGELEGDLEIQLASAKGEDIRRKLPPELFERRPLRFVSKFFFAMGLIAAATAAIVVCSSWAIVGVAMLVNGFMFAHLIELQHECLHNHIFRAPAMNRLFGVACGAFMSISHSHSRYDHVRHHAWLGTPKNREHFNYRYANLHSLSGFVRAIFDLGRYRRIAHILWSTLLGRPVPGIDKPAVNRKVQHEYALYFVLWLASLAAAARWPALRLPFALAWWIPTLFIAEGVHFLIELPEHFGLDAMSEPDVLANTRTMETSRLVSWFVNGNDLHTAHHYHHGVPMWNVRKLHELVKPRIVTVERSYVSFYRDVIAGRVRQP
ncbi:fatty acid desaturase family protein [Pendulispora albinea]|uniref:Fatty acid desaturase n=1 Tax=Pendulispora albinea TaxID=2741071 RepID=A0ABZ2M7N6_9BACT